MKQKLPIMIARPLRKWSTPKLLQWLLLPLLITIQTLPLLAVPLTSPPRVLILDETVSGGASSQEALAAQLAIPGCAVDVVTAANWTSIPGTGTGGPTGFGFDSYRAIIIGDPLCGTSAPGYLSALTALNASKTTWTPVTTGNVIIMGIDNALHAGSQVGADKTVKRGVAFAVNDPTKTGLYYAVSCYYDYTAPAVTPTLIPHLTGFGTFLTRNYSGTCFNAAHQVATHPLFSATPALTDAELSNWSCSTHEGFDAWPPNFVVLAIALTNGVYTATDGSNGVPYMLVRGEGVKVISYIDLNPPSATNAVGTTHTVCATLSTNANPRVGVTVTFTITAGPNVGTTGTAVTDTNGVACFTYTDTGGPGTDFIVASFKTAAGVVISSPTVMKTWVNGPCLSVGCEALQCVTNGVWNYRFCVTNLTKDIVQYVSLLDPPTGVTFTPSIFTANPPLLPGQATNVTVTITAPVGSTNICFTLALHTTNFVKCCGVLHCVALPECCTRIIDSSMTYLTNTGPTSFYNYTITFQNLSSDSVKYVFFAADQPCVVFNPAVINTTLPAYGGPSLMLPGQIRTFTVQVQITSPCPGPLTFLLATHNSNLVECCSSRVRLPAKGSVKLTSPPDGITVVSGTTLELDAALSAGFAASEIRFFEDSTLLTKDSSAPYSTFVSNLTEGSYVFSAAALLTTGEIETSDGVHVTVLSTHQHAPITLGASLSGSAIALSLPTEIGQQWRIEYTDQAVIGPWTTLTNFVGDGTVMTVPDTIQNQKQRFYRAVLTE